jgi:hypothetical protein
LRKLDARTAQTYTLMLAYFRIYEKENERRIWEAFASDSEIPTTWQFESFTTLFATQISNASYKRACTGRRSVKLLHVATYGARRMHILRIAMHRGTLYLSGALHKDGVILNTSHLLISSSHPSR